MAVSVGRVMRSINNFFETGYRATTYSIVGGAIAPDDLLVPGMWIAIEGSAFHDGVYQLGSGCVLTGASPSSVDETFTGKVWFLHPTAGFLELCKDIADFDEKTPVGGYQSESFGSYSYSVSTDGNGAPIGWKAKFAGELAQYYHMFTEVRV